MALKKTYFTNFPPPKKTLVFTGIYQHSSTASLPQRSHTQSLVFNKYPTAPPQKTKISFNGSPRKVSPLRHAFEKKQHAKLLQDGIGTQRAGGFPGWKAFLGSRGAAGQQIETGYPQEGIYFMFFLEVLISSPYGARRKFNKITPQKKWKTLKNTVKEATVRPHMSKTFP